MIMLVMVGDAQLCFSVVAKLNGRRRIQKPLQIRIKPTTVDVSYRARYHAALCCAHHRTRYTSAQHSAQTSDCYSGF
jgi:hypothetical protein